MIGSKGVIIIIPEMTHSAPEILPPVENITKNGMSSVLARKDELLVQQVVLGNISLR